MVEEVIVTGSRLMANPNLAAATPVLSVTGEEANIRGNLRIEDFVNVLPQVFAGQASEVSNGATGTATLNLRGLGAIRTLVLMDGRRLPYGSSQVSAANVDIIPTQLVERVDILTGGASAVYGSDAIGGVANFILRKDFEGVEFGTQFTTNYAENEDGPWDQVLRAANQPVPGDTTDGDETMIYGIIGANSDDGRGNVTLYASYEDREQILQANRVQSGCALGQDDGPNSFGGYGCVGSANFRLFGGGGPAGFGFQQEDGTIVPFVGGPAQTFNFGPFNFFQRPSERYQLFASGHYDLTENVEAYGNISYINNTSDAQIAPSASFGIGAYQINCDNPLIQDNAGVSFADIFGCSAADIANGTIVDGVTASHRNVEGGPRNSRLENSTWRIIGGLRGSFADTWNWSAFIQQSETRDQSAATNDFIIENLQQSLLVTTDENGNPVCTDPSGGCVPYNIFQRGPNGESLVSQESLDFLLGPGLVQGETSQLVFGGDIQANLGDYGIKLPTTDAGIGLLFGFEYREDELNAEPDQISQQPDGGFTGVGGPTLPVSGQIEVSEFFAETEIPLVSDKPFVQELTLRAQYRYSDYKAKGNNTDNEFDTDSYGYSLAWAPISDVRFRGQYQRAVRAPNVIELYTGQGTDLPNLSPAGTNANGVQLFDPCASETPIASPEQCARTGVTAGQYGSILDVISGQTQSITGGNPELEPETADTYTFGVVITPEALPELSVSIDYFDITVEDAIQAGIPAQTTLDRCLASGDETFCSLIQRSQAGSLAAGGAGVGFTQTNINIAEFTTTGVDLQVIYNFDLRDLGSVRVDYAATWLDELDFVSFPGASPIECAGFFGNSCDGFGAAVSPEYRHRAIATWMTPWSLDVSATWRYSDETDNDNENEQFETSLKEVHYFDLSAVYNITDNLQLRAGALNLFGETPPVFTAAGPPRGNGNTYPTVFDTSTTLFASLKAEF